MFKLDARNIFKSNNTLLQILEGCVFGLFLGLACRWLSLLWTLAVVVVVFLIYITLQRPEVALVGILIITASIVFEDQLPTIYVGVSLHIPDIFLLASFAILLVRWMIEPGFKIVKTPLDRPLLVFYGLTLLSTFIAVTQSTVEVEPARRAMRILSYYLTFFIVTNLVKERRQIDFLLRSIFFLATVVAVAMVLQYVLGTANPLLPGRVEALNTQGSIYEDVVRILPPGYSLLLLSFITIFCILVFEKITSLGILRYLQVCLLGMALILTFLRSYWAALIVVLILFAYLVREDDRRRLAGWGGITVCLAALVLALILSDPASGAAGLVKASGERLGTLFDSETFQGSDGALNWRMIENNYAISAIAAHPWMGMGMGFTYRPWDFRIDQIRTTSAGLDFRTFIHNGHLWILLQSGLLGYLSLMWLSFVFMLRGFKYWRIIADPKLKGVVLGFTLTYLSVLISAVVNSSFMQWRWTPVLGIMMGINEVIFLKFSKADSMD